MDIFINKKCNWRISMDKMQLLCAAALFVEKEIVEDTQKMVHANVQTQDNLFLNKKYVDPVESSEEQLATKPLCGFKKRRQPQVITEVASNNGTLLNATKRQRIDDDAAQLLMVGLKKDSMSELEQEMTGVQECSLIKTESEDAEFIEEFIEEEVVETGPEDAEFIEEEVVEIVEGNSKKNASMISVQSRCVSCFYKIMHYINLAKNTKHKESTEIIKKLHTIKASCHKNYLCNQKVVDNVIGTAEDKSFNIRICKDYEFLIKLLTQFINGDEHNYDTIYDEIQDRVIQIRMNYFKSQREKKQSKIIMIAKLQLNDKHHVCELNFLQNNIINLNNDCRKMFNDFMSILSILLGADTHDASSLPLPPISVAQSRPKLISMRATCGRKMSLIQSEMEKIDLLKEITTSKEKSSYLTLQEIQHKYQKYQEFKNNHNSLFQHYQILTQFLHQISYPFCDINIICQELYQYTQKYDLLKRGQRIR